MSFSAFPRHESYGPSTWSRSVVLKNKKTSIFASHDDKSSLALMSSLPSPSSSLKGLSPLSFSLAKPKNSHTSWKNTTTTNNNTITTTPTTTTPQQQPEQVTGIKQKPAMHLQLNAPAIKCPALKSSLRCHSAPTTPTGSKSVKFNPVHLERICLFRKTQTPLSLLKGAHEQETVFHVGCVNFPPRETTDRTKHILLDKKFAVEDNAVIGRVQVRNLAYHKAVFIRYTYDCWQTSTDVEAVYRDATTGQGLYDTFGFSIPLAHLADRGQVRATIDFAVRYHVEGQEFWDNNDGKNYGLQVLADTQEEEEEEDERTEEVVYKATQKGLGNRYSFGLSLSQAKKVVQPMDTVKPVSSAPSVPLIPSVPSAPVQPSVRVTREVKPTPPAHLPRPVPKKPVAAEISRFAAPIPRPTNLFEVYYHSAPSSPTFACQPRHAYLQNTPDLESQSYLDLVNKYCFYGASPTHTPMPINS
ncbi:putative phosphatase regulatory subunit-domain-containing protein [Spinellus fusiger]|nr:putative phosphatase regulatory subunit-domain-containing protein [Spinellus fusiger]